LAAVYAEHFTPFNIAAISLWPGFVATERMTQLMEADPGAKQLKEKMGFESTELSGRVIRALYDDPNLLTLSGKNDHHRRAAERYGIIGPGRVRAEIFAWDLWRPSSCL